MLHARVRGALVARHRRLPGEEVGDARKASTLGGALEVLGEEHHPAEIELRWCERDHLPVQHGDRIGARPQDVAEPSVTPTDARVPLVCGPMGFEHFESALDRGEVAIVARPVVARPFALEVSSKGRPVEGSKLERVGDLRRHVGAVDRGEHIDAGVGDDRSLVAGELGDPAAPGVGQVVGRRDAVHPIHHDEGIAEWRRVGFVPEHLRDRDRRPVADCFHGGGLPAEVVGREDRPRVDWWGEPHGDAPIMPLTTGGPRQVGQQGVAREAALVGNVDPAHDRHLVGSGHAAQPLGESAGDVVAVSGRRLGFRGLVFVAHGRGRLAALGGGSRDQSRCGSALRSNLSAATRKSSISTCVAIFPSMTS